MTKATAVGGRDHISRGNVTRLSALRRSSSNRDDVRRAQDARRHLRSREERFAHLKRMYD